MSMSPDSYRGVLKESRRTLEVAKEQVQIRDKAGLIKPVYSIGKVKGLIVECSEDIGRLKTCIC